MFDDGSWLKTIADWGAYGLAGLGMMVTRSIHSKFKEHEVSHNILADKVNVIEKGILESKLEANAKFVDKSEYYNTMNRIDTKLDKMSDKIDNINNCFINASK